MPNTFYKRCAAFGSYVAGRSVKLRLTHEEIGQLIGASRETVTQLLNDFRSRRLIEVSGERLTVRDQTALEALALSR